MEPRPVSQYAEPAYPTRREFLSSFAAILAAAGVPGCRKESRVSALVAPIFTHGEGRGGIGCIVISPPVFLSEEEALQVVKEELAKAGIELGQSMPMPEVTVEYEDPNSSWRRSGDNWLGDPVATVSAAPNLAAVDFQQRVGVAIVTQDDCRRFRDRTVICTATTFDTKGLAESFAEAIRKEAKHDLRIGVFYDPLETGSFQDGPAVAGSGQIREDFRTRFTRIQQAAADRSRAQLRQQVHDFVTWLESNR